MKHSFQNSIKMQKGRYVGIFVVAVVAACISRPHITGYILHTADGRNPAPVIQLGKYIAFYGLLYVSTGSGF